MYRLLHFYNHFHHNFHNNFHHHFHNHSHLHDRTEFVDWPEPDRSRHLMRLWLSINGDRPLPKCFKQRYGSIKIGDRGGVITKNTTLNVPLD